MSRPSIPRRIRYWVEAVKTTSGGPGGKQSEPEPTPEILANITEDAAMRAASMLPTDLAQLYLMVVEARADRVAAVADVARCHRCRETGEPFSLVAPLPRGLAPRKNNSGPHF